MARQCVLHVRLNCTWLTVWQGLVTAEGLAAPFWGLAQGKEVEHSSSPGALIWNTGWQVIMSAVPEARGVPTLKDHLSFLVTAGFTGWYFIPFEAARSRPLFRSEFSFFRARKGLSSLVQLSGINLFYSSFKFFLMQMNNFRSPVLCRSEKRVTGVLNCRSCWLTGWRNQWQPLKINQVKWTWEGS